MNNYQQKHHVTLFTIGIAMCLIISSYIMPEVQVLMAQNNTTTTLPSAPLTTIKNNLSITLGNPIFSEHDKSTPLKPVVVNGIHGFQASYSGSGVIKGINFSDSGTVLIVPRNKGSSDLSGHAVITTIPNIEKGSYAFYSTGHTDANGTTRDNGAAFFHTNSTGKLGIIDNLVVVFKDQIDKARNGMTIGWEWK